MTVGFIFNSVVYNIKSVRDKAVPKQITFPRCISTERLCNNNNNDHYSCYNLVAPLIRLEMVYITI